MTAEQKPGDEAALWRRLTGEDDDAESARWRKCLLPVSERDEEIGFSLLARPELALGIETVYEGYLVHYGRPRLFTRDDRNLALLLGDRLYARGLVQVSSFGEVAAVADLATLLELCARLQAEGRDGDGALWAAGIASLGYGEIEAEGEAFLRLGDDKPLLRLACERAGAEPVNRALAVHSHRFS